MEENALQIFEHEKFGKIRIVIIDGVIWFVGKDVAIALGYSNPRDALAKHVDDEDKGVSQIATPSGEQSMTILNLPRLKSRGSRD
ncbi:MAG: Bro-N domain-containing protein [Selenomonadaceae bacterium]|nr:Bro-N domain-containing protein [Selenomonadaceae bacterium]